LRCLLRGHLHVMETCKTCRSGLAFYPEHPTPKSCRTQGRRPHVPSSTITMSKSRQQKTRTRIVPRYCYRGTIVRICWRPIRSEAVWLHPVGGVASKQMIDSRQHPFCNFVSI